MSLKTSSYVETLYARASRAEKRNGLALHLYFYLVGLNSCILPVHSSQKQVNTYILHANHTAVVRYVEFSIPVPKHTRGLREPSPIYRNSASTDLNPFLLFGCHWSGFKNKNINVSFHDVTLFLQGQTYGMRHKFYIFTTLTTSLGHTLN